MHVYPSVLSPRMLKHVSRASQQLAKGLLSSPVPMTGRIFFLFLSFFLYYSLLEWGNLFLLIALCYVYGLCYRDHATVALAEMLQPCNPVSGGLTEHAYHWQIILWL